MPGPHQINGNVLYKNDLVNSDLSELYHLNSSASGDDATAYNDLNQLVGFSRGTLSASGNNGSSLDTVASSDLSGLAGSTQSWSLDALGNWLSSTTDGVTTTNTSNSQNELTSSTAGGVTATLTYDNNGNTLTDSSGTVYTYDAWNRQVTATPAGTYHEEYYTYNAIGQRVTDLDGIESGVGPILIINNGTVQNSMIDNLTVVFNRPVTLAAGAFSLVGTNTGAMGLTWSNPSGDDKTFLISFTGTLSNGKSGDTVRVSWRISRYLP
jgi:hypothetical protein